MCDEFPAKVKVFLSDYPGNSCYRSCAHGQSLLSLQLRANESRFCVKTADNCDKSYSKVWSQLELSEDGGLSTIQFQGVALENANTETEVLK